jgi:Uma2 family endonuclease
MLYNGMFYFLEVSTVKFPLSIYAAMKTLAKWTIEEYHQMIEAGILQNRRVELLAGEIIEMPPEGPLHAFYGEEFADYLRNRLAAKALIREARPITLTNSEPEPDIAVVQPPRDNYRNRHPYPEDIFLVIEVSHSTLAKDLEIKRKTYAQAGIIEYWIIDVQNKQLIVFRYPNNDDYSFKQEIKQGNIAMLAFPEVEVTVDRLLT